MGKWEIVPCYIEIHPALERPLNIEWRFEHLNIPHMAVDKHGQLTLKDYTEICLLNLFQFLQVLNCSNVHLVSNNIKQSVNKKRERKGKIPFFEYKTLHIQTTKSKSTNSTIGQSH